MTRSQQYDRDEREPGSVLLKAIEKSAPEKHSTKSSTSSPSKSAGGKVAKAKSRSNVPVLVAAGVLTIILFAGILFAVFANR